MPRRRRLLRILLNAATLVSLLICLGTVPLWALSYYREIGVRWEDNNPGAGAARWHSVSSSRGRFLLQSYECTQTVGFDGPIPSPPPPRAVSRRWYVRPPEPSFPFPVGDGFLGILNNGYHEDVSVWSQGWKRLRFDVYGVPYWLVVALGAIAPLRRVRKTIHARREARRGLCAT